MPILLVIIATLILLASAFAVVFSAEMVAFALEFLKHPGGIWWAAAIRLLVAMALWFSAPVSRTPVAFRVLAVIVLLAAVSIPVMGTERLVALLNWFAAQPLWLVRAIAGFAVAFAAFMLWSVSLKWTTEKRN